MKKVPGSSKKISNGAKLPNLVTLFESERMWSVPVSSRDDDVIQFGRKKFNFYNSKKTFKLLKLVHSLINFAEQQKPTIVGDFVGSVFSGVGLTRIGQTIKTSNNEVQVCSKNKSTPNPGEMKNGQIMTEQGGGYVMALLLLK